MKDELARALWDMDKPGCSWLGAAEWREVYRQKAQAVHDFLGVEKGKELERNAVATMVDALKYLLENDAIYSSIGVGMAEAALRAAGEEV